MTEHPPSERAERAAERARDAAQEAAEAAETARQAAAEMDDRDSAAPVDRGADEAVAEGGVDVGRGAGHHGGGPTDSVDMSGGSGHRDGGPA